MDVFPHKKAEKKTKFIIVRKTKQKTKKIAKFLEIVLKAH